MTSIYRHCKRHFHKMELQFQFWEPFHLNRMNPRFDLRRLLSHWSHELADAETPLKRERPGLSGPIELFGSPAGWEECEAGGEEKMHRLWSPKVTPAVKAIHAYWIPHRLAQVRRQAGQTTH
jgi:hypothetical protein